MPERNGSSTMTDADTAELEVSTSVMREHEKKRDLMHANLTRKPSPAITPVAPAPAPPEREEREDGNDAPELRSDSVSMGVAGGVARVSTTSPSPPREVPRASLLMELCMGCCCCNK